jgi:hypothetical protein
MRIAVVGDPLDPLDDRPEHAADEPGEDENQDDAERVLRVSDGPDAYRVHHAASGTHRIALRDERRLIE